MGEVKLPAGMSPASQHAHSCIGYWSSTHIKAVESRDAAWAAHVAELEAVVGDLVELGIHRAKHPDVYAECVALRAKVAELEAKLAEARAEVERARAEGWEIGHRDGKEWTP